MRKYKMVRFIFSLILIVVILAPCGFLEAQVTDPAETVREFFAASKAGDTETMKRLISGPFYNNRKVLLEKNKKYPQFLREHFKNNIILVEKSTTGDASMVKQSYPKLFQRYYQRSGLGVNNHKAKNSEMVAVLVVRRILPDGNSFYMELLLQKDNYGVWKIVDEVLSD